MALAYYMDVHVPAAITEGLRRRRIDVLTSQEDGTRTDTDDALLQRATSLGRALMSQDADLLQIARDWQAAGRSFAGLVFSAQQAASIGLLIDDHLVAECMSEAEIANQVIFLPLN